MSHKFPVPDTSGIKQGPAVEAELKLQFGNNKIIRSHFIV